MFAADDTISSKFQVTRESLILNKEIQPMNRRIAYYITPHGFGHAVRSLEVIRKLMEMDPSIEIIIVSDLPQFLIEQNLHRPVTVRRRRLDVGLVQRDSVQFDLDATLQALLDLYQRREVVIREEIDFLSANDVQAVVSDIPFLVFHAANECGLPAIGMGNFTWDWIYAGYQRHDKRWRPLVEWIKESYRKCDLFLQLPMHGDCSVCSPLRDVPLIARKAGKNRRRVREMLGCGQEDRAYLISFYDLPLSPEAQRRIERINGCTFYYKQPLQYRLTNGRSLDGFDLSYADAVAAMDGVITKPGYGIVADCMANGTPVIYTDRGVFPEYPILVEEIEQKLAGVYLTSQDLYAGRWESAIRRLESRSPSLRQVRSDGAEVCAELILNTASDNWRSGDEAVVEVPIEQSLDLHTFQPKEVPNLLHDYLEAAHHRGLRQVQIIHGKGAGILRNTVHSILKQHPLVASFQQADFASGGWGATDAFLVD